MSAVSIETETTVYPNTVLKKKSNETIRMKLSHPETTYGYHHEYPQYQNDCGARLRAETKRRFYDQDSDEDCKLTVYNKGSTNNNSDESDSEERGWLKQSRYNTYPTMLAGNVSAHHGITKRNVKEYQRRKTSTVSALPSYRQQHSNWSITGMRHCFPVADQGCQAFY